MKRSRSPTITKDEIRKKKRPTQASIKEFLEKDTESLFGDSQSSRLEFEDTENLDPNEGPSNSPNSPRIEKTASDEDPEQNVEDYDNELLNDYNEDMDENDDDDRGSVNNYDGLSSDSDAETNFGDVSDKDESEIEEEDEAEQVKILVLFSFMMNPNQFCSI